MVKPKADKTLQLRSGARHGKRMLTAAEIMSEMGQNPIRNIARNAAKAEQAGDYATAVRGWTEIQCYLEPKRKPVDPDEKEERSKRIATLEELTRIKTAILAGAMEGKAMVAFGDQGVVDAELVPDAVDDLV